MNNNKKVWKLSNGLEVGIDDLVCIVLKEDNSNKVGYIYDIG